MISSPISNRFKTLVCVAVTHGLALSVIGTAGASPADLDSPLVYTKWQTFGMQEGLPHDSIRAVRIWGNEVWVGTDGGLARLDGTIVCYAGPQQLEEIVQGQFQKVMNVLHTHSG